MATPLEQWRLDNPNWTPTVKSVWEKFREKPTPLRGIKCKCNECMGWDEGGEPVPGIRTMIAECSAPGCPLYDFRPYKKQ